MRQTEIRFCLVLNHVRMLITFLVTLSRYVRVRCHQVVDLLLGRREEFSFGKVKLLLEALIPILSGLGSRNAFAALYLVVQGLSFWLGLDYFFWRPGVALFQAVDFGYRAT